MKAQFLFFTLLTFAVLTGCGDSQDSADSNVAELRSDELKAQEPTQTSPAVKRDFKEASEPIRLYTNAQIYTVSAQSPTVEAFATQNGKFLATGTLKQLKSAYPLASEINLNGSTVIPGFIDAHGHLLGLGQSLLNADLMGTKNKAEIIERLKAKEKELADGQWLLGRGWDQNDWPNKALPSKSDLDEAFPTRPVWLERVDGHAGWANSAALAYVKKNLDGDWQIDGGEILRDDDEKATGVFIDNAASLVESKVPSSTDVELTAALEKAMTKTAQVGLTSMHDAGTSLKTWQLLESLNDQEKLKIRVYSMANGANDMLDHLCESGVQVDPRAMLTARSIKLYSDGALGSRGAALIEDYSDAAGNRGLLIESEETLTQHANRAAGCGLQINIHAIGDRGNRVTLNVLEAATQNESAPGRHRIEHSQVIAPEDFDRFKKLQLVASVQPTHATSDMYWAEERVGSERIKGAYAWQKFIELGIPLALGSDFPVEKPDPLHGFYAAVSRKDHAGWPEKGWYSTQTLSREQALYGFTLGAAYAAFQEKQLGSIETGKYADFTVLSQDIMKVAEADILSTKIMATYINGKNVFSTPN